MDVNIKHEDLAILSGIDLGSEEWQTSEHSKSDLSPEDSPSSPTTKNLEETSQNPQSAPKEDQRDQKDIVSVKIAKEKGGFFFKYVQYVVYSSELRSEVWRRYSDFEWLVMTLGRKYPNRMNPILPGKIYGAQDDLHFNEERRMGLSKVVEFLRWHPVYRDDEIVRVFFQVSEPEKFAWLKKTIVVTEEFVSARIRNNNVQRISEGSRLELEKFTVALPELRIQLEKLIDILERINGRTRRDGVDFPLLGELFDTVMKPAQGPKPSVKAMMERIGHLHLELYKKTHREVIDRLCVHEMLLQAYQECWERREHTTAKDLQAQGKKLDYVRERLSAAESLLFQGKAPSGYVEQLRQSATKEEQDLELMRERDAFALRCLLEELKLVNQSGEEVEAALRELAKAKRSAAERSGSIWADWEEKKEG